MRLPIPLLLLLLPLASLSAKSEREYADEWGKQIGAQIEVRLPDGTRCDILNDTHAIEVDFGRKWAEAIGQSLYYALQTNKRAGILLIIEDISERRFLIRLNSVILANNLPIDVWTTGAGADQ